MTGRDFFFDLCRRSLRPTALIALIAACLVVGSRWSWRPAAAEPAPGESSAFAPTINESSAPAAGLVSLAGQVFPASDGVSGVVLGEYEGYFDALTQSFTMQPAKARARQSSMERNQTSRSNPGSEVRQGLFGLTVINSAFIGTGDNPGTVSGEVAVQNNTFATLYNTRLVFTSFKVCPATGPCNTSGQDAGNLPGPTGVAYFNDGQVAFNNKLYVSRSYGDIGVGANVRNIWTFATVAQPPRFFFTYAVIADLGVAAESVQPAAVQVNASTGTSVLINGRGFTGTPTVELLPAAGSPIAMTGVTASATQITATVPAGTAPGVYSVRVTNPGGAPGGQGSSTLSRRLTVTNQPVSNLSGAVTAISGVGPFLVSGAVTISAGVTIPAGAVFYVAGGATITVGSGGNITAHGGIPGISTTNPAHIVFTAQRSPGAALPAAGAWGGINATAASTAEMLLRNVVVEYGGSAGGANINLTGSGRKLRFTDSIARSSAGAGIAANGPNDSVIGFARNRVDSNGSSAADPAMLVSGAASLGLFDIDTSTGGTSVGDPSFYYSSANDFNGNQADAVQIGADADQASNDFAKSGVLVGQAPTPLRIRGSCGNPAIVGAAPPAAPAELTIAATAIIQLAPEMAFQAGDYASNRIGSIAANGYAGAYQGPQAATSNKLIEFDKIPGGANFGAIFFTRNAMANCILNYVKAQNGGNGANCGLANAEVIAEVVSVKVTNSQINNSLTGGLLAIVGAKIDSKGTTGAGNTPIIETIAGGVLGDGNLGAKAHLVMPIAAALDPLGRGVYIVDNPGGVSLIRFLNTTRNQATIGGIRIPAGVITTIAGGGLNLGNNVPGREADIGFVTGIGVSPEGDIVYFIDAGAQSVRVFNASGAAKTIGFGNVGVGNVGTLVISQNFGSALNGLAVSMANGPSKGDVYICDATAGANKVHKIGISNGAVTTFAGNGALTKDTDAFSPGLAANIPLLQPRALVFDGSNNLYVADTGHGRVIKIDSGGSASLVVQFTANLNASIPPYATPPYPSGLAFFGGKLYIANGNSQDILRVDGVGVFSTLAGTLGVSCDYSAGSNNCGDGGSAAGASFGLVGGAGSPPLAGIVADGKGIFVLDQGNIQRGRVRYINLSQAPNEVAGVTIAAGAIDTVAGTGLIAPFDGGLATSALFSGPTGVAADPNGNLWITDTLSGRLRFVNLSLAPVTLFAGASAEQIVPSGAVVTVNKDVGTAATDNAPVNQAGFDTPQGIWATSQGIYLADSKKGPAVGGRRTGLLRFINTTSQPVSFYSGAGTVTVPAGNIMTIAGGSQSEGSIGDTAAGAGAGLPLSAKFLAPEDVAIAPNGDIYVADAGNKRIRKIVRATGVVSTVLTGGANDAYTGISFDSAGRLLVANAGSKTSDAQKGNSAILREKSPGSGAFDTILSGPPLKFPRDVVEGKDGALYVTNAGESTFTGGDHKLLKIVISGATGTASIFAGSIAGYSGDGGPATSARINITPTDINISTLGPPVSVRQTVNIIATPAGAIIFADSANNAIRRIQ
jgi:sugar lactone lactonase YvrE